METKKDYIKVIISKFKDKEVEKLGFKNKKDFKRRLKQWDKWQLKDLLKMIEIVENRKSKMKKDETKQ